ncbi:MAG: hypothetical protein ACR2NP_22640 [Pirellulaceae bacterium]
MTKKPKTKTKQTVPVVRVVALLSMSTLTLAGIVAGLTPEVILTRVSISTGLLMLITMISVKLFGLITM